MVARKIQYSKPDRRHGRTFKFEFWYKFKMVDRIIQTLEFDRCRGRIFNFDFGYQF